MRRRNRSPFPFKPILAIIVIVLLGVMLFNSGLLVKIGLLKGNIPEDIGIDPNDPRVIEKVDAAVDRSLVKDTVNKLVDLITGQVDQGVVTVIAEDATNAFLLSGVTFELQDAITKEVLDTLITDANGTATSKMIDYKQAYRIVQKATAPEYIQADTEIVIEMKAPIMELHFVQNVKPYILKYSRNDDGTIEVTEMNLNVPVLLQTPELPNGCEITALTSLINFYGDPINKVTLSDQFLPKSPFYKKGNKVYGADPNIAFSGDPKDAGGWFVYAAPTVKAGQDYFKSVSSDLLVTDLTGSNQEQIMDYVMKGIPVAVWATRDLSMAKFGYGWYLDGTETYFDAATNLHCMVIYGVVDDKLYVMDPLQGSMIYDRATLFQSYESLGSRAMVVEEPINE